MVTRRIPRGNFVYLCAWSRVCTGNVWRRIRAPVRTDMGDPRVTYVRIIFFYIFQISPQFYIPFIRQMQLSIDKIGLGQNRNNKAEAFSLTESYIGERT